MKSKFPGYFKLTEDEINQLWENALFVFDANILLNLYRYSDETRDDFFKILEKIKDRVWIPHQSASEFFENRLNVISQQEKSYEEASNSLKAIENEFENSRQHPFISQKLLKKFSNLSKEICEQLKESKDFHNKRINQDDVLEKIEILFNEKVGNEYQKNQLEEIYKEGEVRFLDKVPPGYKDSGKKDDSSKDTRKYGDLVVWKQILDKSKELKQGIILITDDRKEDWWIRFKGKTLSPRPELKKEFQTETKQSFHMYQSDRFLEFATKYLNEEINENAIQEIRDLRKLDERKRLQDLRRKKDYFKYKERREELLKQRILLEEELKFIEDKRGFIESALEEQYSLLNNDDPSAFDDSKMKRLKRDLHIINRKTEHINSNLDDIKRQEFKERIIRNKTMHNNGYN
jgi:predicted nucleic acid-binding protein